MASTSKSGGKIGCKFPSLLGSNFLHFRSEAPPALELFVKDVVCPVNNRREALLMVR